MTKNGFFDLFPEDKIFKDPSVFSKQYLPPAFTYRDEEYKQVGEILKDTIRTASINGYINGPPGTGKTHITKKLIKLINEYCKANDLPVQYFFVNCRNATYTTVLTNILHQLNPSDTGRGVAPIEIINKIRKYLGEKNACFIFDEIDRILPTTRTNTIEQLLGDFSRFNESCFDNSANVIIIANNPTLDDQIDASTKSTFRPVRVRFRDYAPGEVRDIIWERCKIGFREGVISLDTVANFSLYLIDSDHDLRTAFNILLESGNRAKNNGSKKITMDSLKTSFKRVEMKEFGEYVNELNELQQIIFYIIAKIQLEKKKAGNPEQHLTSEEIIKSYAYFVNKLGLDERTSRHITETVLPKMETQGYFITGKSGQKGKKGWTKTYSIQDSRLERYYDVLSQIMFERYGIIDKYKKKEKKQQKQLKLSGGTK